MEFPVSKIKRWMRAASPRLFFPRREFLRFVFVKVNQSSMISAVDEISLDNNMEMSFENSLSVKYIQEAFVIYFFLNPTTMNNQRLTR